MTNYDLVYEAMVIDEFLAGHGLGWRNNCWELFDGDYNYTEFLVEKVNEFEKYWEDITNNGYYHSVGDAAYDFVEKNIEKWKRELRGEKLYKIKVVLEIDATVNNKITIDEIVKNIETSIGVESDDAWGWNADSWKIINAIGKEVNE